ncbi:hypothetical protein BN1723_004878, partial [Verticillium longisporum]
MQRTHDHLILEEEYVENQERLSKAKAAKEGNAAPGPEGTEDRLADERGRVDDMRGSPMGVVPAIIPVNANILERVNNGINLEAHANEPLDEVAVVAVVARLVEGGLVGVGLGRVPRRVELGVRGRAGVGDGPL